MKKIIALAIVLLILLQLQAQKVALYNTVLWKISGNGLPKDSYIFLTGSSCEESLKLNDKLKEVLKKVNTVAVEYDLYGTKDANKLATNNIATLDSQKIKNNLTPGQIAEFENILKKAGYPEQAIPQLQVYKMNMVYYMLSAINGPCGLERQPLVYELELKALAKKSDKEYVVLQNVDEFLKESNSHSSTFWKQNVGFVLKNADNIKTQLNNEADLYKKEQLKDLQKLYKNEQVFKLLYSDGLDKMHVAFLADKIEKQIQLSASFISMQIANVLYEDCSVFESLVRKGYKITPILNKINFIF